MRRAAVLGVIVLLTAFFGHAGADDYSSTNFIVRDPVITIEGGRAASPSFEYFSATGQAAAGENTSAGFIHRGGFLYFPTTTATGAPPPAPSPAPSGGGGGGGYAITPQALFRGLAYPGSTVTVLKDGQTAASALAGPDARFEVGISGLSAGSYNFAVYATDRAGRRPIAHTYTIGVTPAATVAVSGIFLPPTIAVDKSEVRRGDILSILGQTVPRAAVSVAVNSSEPIVKKVSADAGGGWFYKLDTAMLEYGDHSAQARAATDDDVSPLSQAYFFKVGTVNKDVEKPAPPRGDVNTDGKVNLIDFSIAAYWFRRPSSPAHVDLDGNGVINLIDFSIMAYYWTG